MWTSSVLSSADVLDLESVDRLPLPAAPALTTSPGR